MRTVNICISISFGCHQCSGYEFEIEVEDGASDDDIRHDVDEVVFELVNWGYEIKESAHD